MKLCAANRKGFPEQLHFNLSGHGLLDLGSYATYFAGNLENSDFHPKEMEAAIMELPVV